MERKQPGICAATPGHTQSTAVLHLVALHRPDQAPGNVRVRDERERFAVQSAEDSLTQATVGVMPGSRNIVSPIVCSARMEEMK